MSDDVLTLARLNSAPHKDFVGLLAGIYERSPWVSERAWPRGPFLTLAQLKRMLVEVVTEADGDEQLARARHGVGALDDLRWPAVRGDRRGPHRQVAMSGYGREKWARAAP